jgi:hypothetical protein
MFNIMVSTDTPAKIVKINVMPDNTRPINCMEFLPWRALILEQQLDETRSAA